MTMKPTKEELANNHGYHPPKNPEIADLHELVRQATLGCADRIRVLCPESRQLSLALTKLEEARMWANAAIACNQEGA